MLIDLTTCALSAKTIESARCLKSITKKIRLVKTMIVKFVHAIIIMIAKLCIDKIKLERILLV